MNTQTKAGHTALPWKIESNVKYPKRLIYSADETLKPYQRSIGSTDTDDGKNGEANADFIVKATNNFYPMLEALKITLRKWDEYVNNSGDDNIELMNYIGDIREIILKAGVK